MDNLEGYTREQKEQLLALLEEKDNRARYNYISSLWLDDDQAITLPGCTRSLSRSNYPKHLEFFKAGNDFTERAFIAGNRCGKTLTGLCELYWHCSGDYPSWWEGKRFTKPIVAWLCGDRGEVIRDGMQPLLVGHTEFGTGIIPKDKFEKEPVSMPGVPQGFGQYFIKHVSGGISKIIIKTYQAGQAAFESAAVDVIMLDEECPINIYVECQMRTATTGGIVYLTFTPDSGLTDTVLHFLDRPKPGEPKKFVSMVGWENVPHLAEDVKEKLLAAIPPHMRAVKTRGEPYLSAGAIYPIPVDEILVTPFAIPDYWPKAYAFDPGWNRTAALFGAYDASTDCWYLYDEYYRGQAEPEVHAGAIRAHGSWMLGVADPHGSRAGRGVSADSFLEAYEKHGLELILANPCGPGSVEIGITEVYSRLSTGRLKVFRTLQNWLYEYRIYRRDENGKPIATNNHLMDTTRYLMLNGQSIMDLPPEDVRRPKQSSYDTERNSITGY